MNINKKKINAYLVIAILFVLHILKKFVFKLKGSGVEEFKKNYYPEFLIEIPKESYDMMYKFEACINCSLCDSHCSSLTTFHRDGLPKVSELVLSTSSSIEEFRFSDNILEVFNNCEDCEDKCYSICPNEIPVFDLINVMKNYNQDLDKKLDKLRKEKNE